MTGIGGSSVVRTKRYWQTSDFWKDAGERVVTAFIEGVTGIIGVDWILSTLNQDFPTEWWIPPLAGGFMGALSAVKAIVGAQRSNTTTPVSIL